MGCREEIVHQLSESDANRLVSFLHDSHIDAEKVAETGGTWRISVKSSDSVIAIKSLINAKFFSEPESPIKDRNSLIPSREDQQFMYERGLSKEIERTLSTLDGVLAVRVHLNLPPQDPIFGERLGKTKGSASVLLVVEERFLVPTKEVASLVSGAAGVDSNLVSVLVTQSIRRIPERKVAEEVRKISSDVQADSMPKVPLVAGATALGTIGYSLIAFGFKRRRKTKETIL